MSDNVVQLPVRPSEADPAETLPKYQPHADWAHEPAPAREKKTLTDGLGLWLRIQSAFAGASLLDATPPALTLIWERHRTAARPWGKVLGSLRYLWGMVHVTMIAPVLYFLVWATDSCPKLAITTAAIITTLLWFPHFTFTITL